MVIPVRDLQVLCLNVRGPNDLKARAPELVQNAAERAASGAGARAEAFLTLGDDRVDRFTNRLFVTLSERIVAL